ncbi:MAG: hypothetical protein QOF66_4955 [Mycobacterium sp.]|jgi:hypothetical protein|nr:hypothetical protein [Mycobacterium sp.]
MICQATVRGLPLVQRTGFMDSGRLSAVGDTRCTVLLDHSSLTEIGLAGPTSGIAVT